jgi:hypothetical protein
LRYPNRFTTISVRAGLTRSERSPFIGLLSRAQFTKGSILLGGDLGAATGSDKTTTTGAAPAKSSGTSFDVDPSIGWMVQNNLLLGVNLGVGYSSETGLKDNNYALGVFMRKYKTLAGRLYFFGETGLNFNYDDYISNNGSGSPSYQEQKSSNVILGFAPGIGYSLTHRWQLEIEFPDVVYAQYSHSVVNTTYITQVYPTPIQSYQHGVGNGFSFNTSLTNSVEFELGLRFLIGK